MDTGWLNAISHQALKRKGKAVIRQAGKQIALFDTPTGVYACNNRCPHEGNPLREGTLDDGCVLTCDWHNWKFDLRTGDNLFGGDRLRVYPVEICGGAVWVDVKDPAPAKARGAILANLHAAFVDNDYGRIAREIERLRLAGGEPTDAVVKAIGWSYERLEFGWTHAYAGAADWLALYDQHAGDDEARLICLTEIVGHIAEGSLRHKTHAFTAAVQDYDEGAFVAAINDEDEAAAVAMIRGSLDAGLEFAGLERGLARTALAHYADFGHSLIYVAKAGRLIERLGPRVALPLLLSLVRSIVYATREERLPEFRHYAPALESWGGAAKAPEAAAFRGLNAKRALTLLAGHGGADPRALYRTLLAANAQNMLAFDLAVSERTDRPPGDNVGWLDFTHALTFANAVRLMCSRFPELWPAGLLQLACFSGRNAPYTDASLDGSMWRVEDTEPFFEAAVAALFDHGRAEYIVSVHVVKTLLAAREEVQNGDADEASVAIVAALNRFLNSPLKRKHTRRTARQAMAFVALDA